MTGALLYEFTYNVNSYYGRLVRVTDVLDSKSLLVRRDYRLHAQHLTAMATAGARRRVGGQSQRQQRCHVTTDSNGLLASLTTPTSVTTRFSYMTDTGLLVSRQVDSDWTNWYEYQYDGAGRVTTVISATAGRQCFFTATSWRDDTHSVTQHNYSTLSSDSSKISSSSISSFNSSYRPQSYSFFVTVSVYI